MQNFLPHAVCLSYNPVLIALMILGDVAVGVSYYLIPVSMFLFVMRYSTELRLRETEGYPDWFARIWSVFRVLVVAFAAFIFFCGTGHFLDVLVLYYPFYWVQAIWDLMTGLVSAATFFLFIFYRRRLPRHV